MIRLVVGLLIQGLVFGVAVRAVLPGEQKWSIPQTLGIGVVGALAIGLMLRLVLSAFFALLVPLLILGGVYLFLASRRGAARR